MEKRSERKNLFVLAIVVLLLVPGYGRASTDTINVVDILYQSYGMKEEITIVADREFSASSRMMREPDRIVIEAAHVDPGIFSKEILINGSLVEKLVPVVSNTDNGVTSFELFLAQSAGHLLNQNGNALKIVIDKALPIADSNPVVEQVAEAEPTNPVVIEVPEIKEPEATAIDGLESIELALATESEPIVPDNLILEAAAPLIIAQTEAEPAAAAPAASESQPAPGGTLTVDLGADSIYGLQAPEKYTGKPISLDFKDIDVLDVFRLIAEVSGFNVVIDPDVKGKITIRLDNVPWDQALDVILKNQGLDKEIEGNVMRIAYMTKLRDERVLKRQMEEAKARIRERDTKIVYLSYAKSADIAPLIKKLLSVQGDIIIDDRTNSLIVLDFTENIERAIKLIKILDVRTKQVFINAQIVRTDKNFSRQLGIQWGGRFVADAVHGNTSGYQFPNQYMVDLQQGTEDGYAVNLPSGSQLIGLTFGNVLDTLKLRAALTAAESEGLTKTISNPRVTTSDNKKANVTSGSRIPYQTFTKEGTGEIEWIDAGIKLDATPHVTHDNFISMNVSVTKDAPDFSNLVNGAPPINQNRASTDVIIKDGETLVIGGLNETIVGDSQARIPFLGRIPILGLLFKNMSKSNKFSDLLIFITPQIMKWGEQAPITGEL